MTHHYLPLNNIQIHYIQKLSVAGDVNRAILFIHGRAMSTESWEQQFISETLSDYPLIALDLPGHGNSDHSHNFNDVYSVAGLKDILLKFIDELKLTNYILVGLSLGGHIALQSLPDLRDCKGVFALTMPITKPVQPASMYLNLDLLTKVFQENSMPEDVTSYASTLLRSNVQEVPVFIEKAYYQSDPKIHTGILNSLLEGEHLDEIEIIKGSNVPIAVVAGIYDQVHNLDYMNSFDLPLWRNSIQLINEAGHLPPWENPDDVNLLLTAFSEDCFEVNT